MDQHPPEDLTALIHEAKAGDVAARDRLFRAIYKDFHRIAETLMRGERPGHTLQPSALVNEAVIRLFDGEALEKAPNRRYLFAAASRAMRQALIDHHRRRHAGNRAGDRRRVPLDDVLAYFEDQRLDIIALNSALDRLAELDERRSLVVALRYFAGLSVGEVADALEVSVGTVEADWRFARAWLRTQIAEDSDDSGSLATGH